MVFTKDKPLYHILIFAVAKLLFAKQNDILVILTVHTKWYRLHYTIFTVFNHMNRSLFWPSHNRQTFGEKLNRQTLAGNRAMSCYFL